MKQAKVRQLREFPNFAKATLGKQSQNRLGFKCPKVIHPPPTLRLSYGVAKQAFEKNYEYI